MLREIVLKSATFGACAASDWVYGFLYNDRVGVRKEGHGWIGCFGSE